MQQEQETFCAFHQEHSTSILAGSPCQYTLVNEGNEYVQSKNIPHDTFAFDCDWGDAINIFNPQKTHAVGMNYNLHRDLVNCRFDHLFISLYSIPSIDQLGYSRCACASIAKWASNPKFILLINGVHEEMGFPKLVYISDAQARILITLCSHCFISGEISCEVFQSIMNSVDESEDEVFHNQDILCEEDIESFIEWLLMSSIRYIAGDDETTLAKQQRNM